MKYKKRVNLILASIMLVSAFFTGCSSNGATTTTYKDDENEQVTLTMVIPSGERKDSGRVVDEINKRLETLLPNTTVDIVWEGGLGEKWVNWMAVKKKIDLVHSGYFMELEPEVNRRSFLELDELIDSYAPTLKSQREKYWHSYDSGVINGQLYAIPNTQMYLKDVLGIGLSTSSSEGIKNYIDAEALIQEAWSNDKTTEKFWQIIDDAFEEATSAGVDCKGLVGLEWLDVAKKGYHFIGGSNVCYDNSEEVEILDFYTTDEYKTYCSYMKKWAERGYVSPDVLTGGLETMGARTRSSFHVDKETGYDAVNNLYCITNPDEKILTTDIGQEYTYWSIPFTSEHPVRAIKFLDLLNSEAGGEILNLLAFGFEGEHYEVLDKEKGEIKAFEYDTQPNSSVSYGVASWVCGNMLEELYVIYPYTAEEKQYAYDYHTKTVNSLEKHVLYGISFDLTAMDVQLNNILRINTEYENNVISGLVGDQEKLSQEHLEKNKKAGIEEVIAELQKQADEFLASKK